MPSNQIASSLVTLQYDPTDAQSLQLAMVLANMQTWYTEASPDSVQLA